MKFLLESFVVVVTVVVVVTGAYVVVVVTAVVTGYTVMSLVLVPALVLA